MSIKLFLAIFAICIFVLETGVFGSAECVYQESLIEYGRKCRKPCLDSSECKGKKLCQCDGPCGMSCFYNRSDCEEPESIANGRVEREHTLWMAEAYYSCNDGYVLDGENVRTCHSDKVWYPGPPSCKRPCEEPDEPHSYPTNGETEFLEGRSYIFSCDSGYYMTGDSSRTCLETAKWSVVKYRCFRKMCESIVPVRHGTIHYSIGDGPVFGTTATVECKNGYKLSEVGLSMRCYAGDSGSRFGEWNGRLPSCLIISCPRPEEPENGEIPDLALLRFEYGNEISYACNRGYMLKGPRYSRCTENENWSSTNSSCIVDPSCDFDSFDYPTCGFTIVHYKWTNRDSQDVLRGRLLQSNSGTAYLVSMRIPPDWTSQSHICLEFDYKITRDSSLLVQKALGSMHKFWQTHPREITGVWLDALVEIKLENAIQFQFKAENIVYLDNVAVYEGTCDNHCLRMPCNNGGTCVNRKRTFSCICTVDFTGFVCDIGKKCPELPERIKDGKLSERDRGMYLPGRTAVYECYSGYKFSHSPNVISRVEVTCEANTDGSGRSEWNTNPQKLACEVVTCAPPKLGKNQRLVSTNTRWIANDQATFSCHVGFYMNPAIYTTQLNRRCQLDGQWSGELSDCIKPYCTFDSSGNEKPDVVFPQTTYNKGVTIKLKCVEGYELNTDDPFLTCTGLYTWNRNNRNIPNCQRITCGVIPRIPHYYSSNYPEPLYYGESFTYAGCRGGWSMVENRKIKCKSDKTYTKQPICRQLGTCTRFPVIPENCKMQNNSNHKVVRFTCNKLHHIIGNTIVACEHATRQWTETPICTEIQPTSTTVYNGIQYLVYLQNHIRSNYEDAQNLCRSINADLAILYSQTVRERFEEALQRISGRDFRLRIGLKRRYTSILGRETNEFIWDWKEGESRSNLPKGWKNRNDRHWAYDNPRYDAGDCVVVDSTPDVYSSNKYRWKVTNCDNSPLPFVCQRNHISCEPNPCKNGGTCNVENGIERCSCPHYFFGDYCETETTCAASDLENMEIIFGKEDRYSVGSRVFIRCSDGYRLVGKNVVTCGSHRSWNSQANCEEIKCANPPLPVHGRFLLNNHKYGAGKNYDISCENKYRLMGDSQLYCGWDGEWADTTSLCEKIVCSAPSLPANAKMSTTQKQTYEMDDWISLRCNEGYEESEIVYPTCNRDSQWDFLETFRCIPKFTSTAQPNTRTTTTTTTERTPTTTANSGLPCTEFPHLPQGSFIHNDPGSYPSGSSYEIRCEADRDITGSSSLTCNGGEWNEVTAKCELIICRLDQYLLPYEIEVQGFELHQLQNEKFSVGKILTLVCSGSGVVTHLNDESIEPQITCQRGGTWQPWQSMFYCG
ncbi:sushi, von Willebrand factor type A, EGF and pentraxin domain-containing protein 1-like isoform X2 [Styela clava]